MNRITLTKFMSRERSLFYFCVWSKSNFEDERFSNTYENIVFLNKGEGKTVTYFDLDEVKHDLEDIQNRLKKKGFIDEVIKDYMNYWSILFEYVQKKKVIKNLKDLRYFYENWLIWWHSMATLFLLADIEKVPLEIREKSLDIRKKHERYSEEGNRLFIDFFKNKFPNYVNLAEVVTPDEVFSLEKNKFNEKKLAEIKNRLKGWVMINGDVYPINELEKELKVRGIEIREENIKLTKKFSRERSLIYGYLWYNSDSKGIEKWFGIKWKNALYMKEEDSNKISIWYDDLEVNAIINRIKLVINNDPKVLNDILSFWEEEWNKTLPFLKGDKKIEDINSFRFFYEHMVRWWYAMNDLYFIPDIDGVAADIKKICIKKRIETEKYSDKTDNLLMDFLSKNRELKKISSVITPEEVYRFFEGKKIDFKNIEKRVKGYGLFNGKLYNLNDLDKVLKKECIELETLSGDGNQSIQGKIAYPGTIRGIARVISSKNDLDLLKKGEILVSEMTHPGYVTFLNKVSAIVTDEGGIVCHAAIVSREMKIPCIVGTKVATKIFKTGDLVEVDANKGIVRKIK